MKDQWQANCAIVFSLRETVLRLSGQLRLTVQWREEMADSMFLEQGSDLSRHVCFSYENSLDRHVFSNIHCSFNCAILDALINATPKVDFV